MASTLRELERLGLLSPDEATEINACLNSKNPLPVDELPQGLSMALLNALALMDFNHKRPGVQMH